MRKLVRLLGAPFAWKVVRRHNGWTYLENAVTGQRCGEWDGVSLDRVDYKFLRAGDIVHGMWGRKVLP
jgi:hypothetical protein